MNAEEWLQSQIVAVAKAFQAGDKVWRVGATQTISEYLRLRGFDPELVAPFFMLRQEASDQYQRSEGQIPTKQMPTNEMLMLICGSAAITVLKEMNSKDQHKLDKIVRNVAKELRLEKSRLKNFRDELLRRRSRETEAEQQRREAYQSSIKGMQAMPNEAAIWHFLSKGMPHHLLSGK